MSKREHIDESAILRERRSLLNYALQRYELHALVPRPFVCDFINSLSDKSIFSRVFADDVLVKAESLLQIEGFAELILVPSISSMHTREAMVISSRLTDYAASSGAEASQLKVTATNK